MSHYLNQWWLVYWRIYMSLSLNDLKFHIRPKHCHVWLSKVEVSNISPFPYESMYMPRSKICVIHMGVSRGLKLTHWNLNKIAAMLQTVFSDAFSWKKIHILIQMSLKFFLHGATDKTALFQIIVWHQRGNKPLPEIMLILSCDDI